jgi:peptidoglycan/LPS O-acetylase OafA/YrhL
VPVNTRAAHYPLMDSMRGIAVIAVVATHTTFFTALHGSQTTQVRFGFISVTVFFVLSAFLLYGPWVAARLDDRQPPSIRGFAWRRFLRVVPAYYVALTIIAIALGLSYVFTLEGAGALYGFAQVYSPEYVLKGLPQAWTLCAEAIFYAFLPLWAALMRRLRADSRERRVRLELMACAGLFTASLVYKVAITATGTIEGHWGRPLQLNFLTFLDDFAIGMALATLAAAYRGRSDQPRAIRAIDRHPSIAWAAGGAVLLIGALTLGLLGQVGDILTSGTPYVVRHYMIELIAVGLLLPGMFGDPSRGLVRRILRNRALLYVGMVSYGVYLWHLAILEQLGRWNFESVAGRTSILWFAVVLPASVVLATLSYYLIERPFLSRKGLVRSRPAPNPGEAIAEPAPTAPTRP